MSGQEIGVLRREKLRLTRKGADASSSPDRSGRLLGIMNGPLAGWSDLEMDFLRCVKVAFVRSVEVKCSGVPGRGRDAVIFIDGDVR